LIGQRVGPYAVLQRLGGGGMGEVYLAEDTRLGRLVALKRPSEEWLSLPDARERLHREASAAGRLTHPNIAAIYDVLDVDSQPYIVMEYVEGESLARVLRRGALPLDNAVAVGTEIAEALAAAHAKGIVHRDLKPANISLTPDGHAKVLDFGLAKGPPVKKAASSPGGLTTITVPGQAMGTPGYSSPEQLVGAPADPRDDIYSLGVVLYELLTGRRPFDGTDSLELAMATMTKTPAPAHQVNPAVPEAISAIVARAMARDRGDRYQSAEQLRTELRRLTHALSTDVTHLVDSGALTVTQRRRRRRVAVAVAAIALVAAAGVGVWWKDRPPVVSRPPVLGVKAFATGSVESDAPLAAGVRDWLISTLAKTPGLVLVSRSAIDEAARQHADPRTLARDLDATHLLEAAVVRSGKELTVSVTLLRGDSGQIVWNDSLSAPETNVGELQQRIVDGVRRALLIPAAAGDQGQANPGTTDVLALTHYGRATILLERPDVAGNLARAEALLRTATQRDPKFALAWARLGDTCWENYRISSEPRWASEAVSATNTALTLDQRQPEVWISLAKINEGTGRREAALSALNKALELQPASDEARQLMGQIFQATGRRDEAKAQYLQAIELRPDYWRHHSMLGAFYYATGSYAEAIAAFTRVTQLAPDNGRGFHNLGAVYYRIGDSRNALINYERALDLNPRPETRSAIGNIHYDEGRYQAALDAFLEAAKESENDGVLRGNVGDAYARLGRLDEARQAWREAVRLEQQTLAVNLNDANTLARIALWQAKAGDRAAAESHITRALTMAAGDAEVLYYAAVVRALAGDTERALTSLEQAVKSGYSAQLAAKDRDLDTIRNTPRFRALAGTSERSRQ
jgi:tetratricopeptide (TPR) repeat protein